MNESFAECVRYGVIMIVYKVYILIDEINRDQVVHYILQSDAQFCRMILLQICRIILELKLQSRAP